MSSFRDVTILLRPHQWIKNLFVFPALIFSRHLFDPYYFIITTAAFVLFCVVSSGVYILNDIMDADEDRHHPRKKRRPVASGRVPVRTAWWLFAVLSASGLALSFMLNVWFGVVAGVYFVMNLGYSLGLKRVVIIDVLIVAIGFVMRAVAGGVVISVEVSEWFLVCTMLIALFLVLAKRRHELTLMDERNNMLLELSLAAEDLNRTIKYRHSLEEYSPYFLDQMIGVTTASTLMAYILYTLSDDVIEKFGGTQLMYTVPFVIYGIFRYLYLIYRKGEGGSPATAITSDKPLMADVILWGLCVVVVLYFS